ncbi:MAG TPA: hypothetical protein VMJ10_37895 [Kofleriaceae bacterium]|nr:hypothetical protein [Kofleriaceae bacterium]
MARWLRVGAIAGGAIAACHFQGGNATSDGASDAVPDGPSMCPSLFTACSSDGTTLISCSVIGSASTSLECPWGCLGGGDARCAELVATGGAVDGSDFDSSAMPGLLADVSIDTDTGMITDGSMQTTQWSSYRLSNGVGIFSFSTLTLGGTITFSGSSAAAFVATGEIDVTGYVDARGNCGDGAGHGAGPGGFKGAQAGSTGKGSGSGGEAGGDSGGGGGGGYGGQGGAGGYNNASSNAGAAGSVWGDAVITTLVGGGGGGAASDPNGGDGGGGGGALQLVSNATIAIEAGSGVGINAGGCGGKGANGTHGGGGGGAGGTIVLEAPTLMIAGTLAVNGGGGGGGDSPGAKSGNSGVLGSTAAAGGAGHNNSGDEDGGTGGAGTQLAGSTAPHGGGNGGGGGGGVGRIRLNSRAGMQTTTLVSGAVVSPDPTATATTATVGTAAVK